MGALRHILLGAFLWLAAWGAVSAQEDDKGFLTRALQDALSGAGRTVSIDGFRGALSSSASFDRMTIADDQGIWLTLEDVSLVWTRSALLRGRLEVESLTAARLDLPRLPEAEESALPPAEAQPFSLPELPVSVQIETFAIDQITLGEPLLGEAAQLGIIASAALTDEGANVVLQAKRLDGKRGAFDIKADFDRAQNLLDLDLNLSEGEAGLAARLMDLPGQPSVDLTLKGSGPVDDFAADIALSTDGQARLAGQVVLGTEAAGTADSAPDQRIQADIAGDITSLLAPQYRDFFGPDVALVADALLASDGTIDLRRFALRAQSARLEGRVALDAAGWPALINISGDIANDDGTPILLPLGGDGTTVEAVTLRVDYDAAQGEALVANFDLTGLAQPALTLAQTRLALRGSLQSAAGSIGAFRGDVDFDASGLSMRDAALAEALGESLRGKMRLDYVAGQPVKITGLDLTGTDVTLAGKATIHGIDTGLRTDLDATLAARDLSRFSALAGQEIDGQVALQLTGRVAPLNDSFSLRAAGSSEGLAIGIPQADAVLAGRTELTAVAARDENGTFLRQLDLRNPAIDLTGTAALRSGQSAAQAQFRLADVSLVVPQYTGPVTVNAKARQDASGWSVDAVTDGPYGAALTAKGLVTGPQAAIRFTADVPRVEAFAEQVRGPLQAAGTLQNTPQGWRIETQASGPYGAQAQVAGLVAPQLNVTFDLSMPQVGALVPQISGPLAAKGQLEQTGAGYVIRTSASGPYGASARVEGLATGPDAALRYVLSMPNVGALVPDVNGPLSLDGTAQKAGQGWRIETAAAGPEGTRSQLSGLVNPDGTLALGIAGTAPLGLARPFIAPRDLQGIAQFDLRLDGPAALSALSGRIGTSGARFSAPNLRVALTDIAGEVTLGGNRAQIGLLAQASNGGQLQVAGPITLTGAMPADLQIGLQDIVLIDPRLYRASVAGNLRVAGPLTGGAAISGQLGLGETMVSVPATGLTSIGDIPPITHIGATRPVMSTRRKAGLEAAEADPVVRSGPGFALDLGINAPNRIFVRGRGLDAELGGGLRLTGNTNRMISAGRFDLLRGRLDILGKRFELREGAIQFEGDLVPYLRFVSATPTAAGEVRVIVEGPADAPEVSFEATPEAPEDEVLAQLLFGRHISEISAFQALQLANAVATLAGRGGVQVIGNLRDGFGLDDLDVTTSEDGTTAVRAGKYISDNIYTDVTAGSDGTGEVSLNLDITPNLKGKATLGSDGNSSLGIFFEKDY